MKEINVAFIGPPGSGKTSLINTAMGEKGLEVISTINAGFSSIIREINEQVCDIRLWDTPGQQNYLQMAKGYLRNIDIVLFCFFDDLDEYDLYNNAISDTIPEKAKKWLIQTKIDIGEQYTVGNEFLNKNFIEQFFKTSALQNIGIEDLLKAIASLEKDPMSITPQPQPRPIIERIKENFQSFC